MEVKTYTQTLEFLRSYIEPVASTAEKAISEALGFVLAEDQIGRASCRERV